MVSVIERKNGHKLKYLQRENAQLKHLLDDAENNLEINKNLIKAILSHQDNKYQNVSVESQSAAIEKLNEENRSLLKQIKMLRRDYDTLNSEILIKDQILEEKQIHALNEYNNISSELEALKHKYDRKELVL
jgi:seryl-tRNA synthetase